MIRQFFTTTLVFAMVGGSLAPAAYKDMLRDAHKGDVVAMRKVGYNQFTGSGGVTQNRKTGLAWLKRAAEKGDAQALYYLGCIYQNGAYVGVDKEEAARYFAKAAAKGHEKAKKKLAELKPEGKQRPAEEKVAPEKAPAPSPKKPAPIVEKEKEMDPNEQYEEGRHFVLDVGNLNKGVQCFKAAAEHGHADAQFALAQIHLGNIVTMGMIMRDDFAFALVVTQSSEGKAYPKDEKEGVKWLQAAADQGVVGAQLFLGQIYSKGEVVTKDIDNAKKYYRAAAAQGDKDADEALKDLEKAEKEEAKKAQEMEQDKPKKRNESRRKAPLSEVEEHAESEYRKGLACLGKGTNRYSAGMALLNFSEAARNGHVKAQYMFAICNAAIMGVNNPESAENLKKAAEKGHVGAMVAFSLAYKDGMGVPTNDKKAKKWALKAYKMGANIPNDLLQMVADDLSLPSELVKGISLAGAGNEVPANMESMLLERAADNDMWALYLLSKTAKNKATEKEEQYLLKAAKLGHVLAQYDLACFYLSKNQEESAISWFHKADQQGWPAAAQKLWELDALDDEGAEPEDSDEPTEVSSTAPSSSSDAETEYQKGLELENTSPQKAFTHYETAAKQGHSLAQFKLGVYYYDGEVIPKNDAQAFKWFKKAAEQGDIDAQFNLAIFYAKGVGTGRDLGEAIKWYRRSAEQGSARAQNNLGTCYFTGEGVPRNDAEAFKWYKRAAEQGHATAQNNLGLFYHEGRCVPQSDREAAKWWRKAAEQGIADAQRNLGVCYANGRGVPQSDTEAAKWWGKAAEQGHARAQFIMGGCYSDGRGVPRSEREAVKWYRRAAEQGEADAQLILGFHYADGRGVPQSDTEAAKWYRRAAEQGNADAQFYLSECYVYGRGVPESYTETIKWLQRAARQGHAKARELLNKLNE